MNVRDAQTKTRRLRRGLRLFLLMLITSLCLPITAMAAETVSTDLTNLVLEFDGVNYKDYLRFSADNDYGSADGSVSGSAKTITVQSKGEYYKKTVTTLNISNKNSKAPMKIYFTTGGTAFNTAPTSPLRLEANEGNVATFTLEAGFEWWGSGKTVTSTIQITNIVFESVPIPATFQGVQGGSYTVVYNGDESTKKEVTTEPVTMTNSKDHPYTLTATPVGDYELFGWYSNKRGLLTDDDLTTPNSINIYVQDEETFKPIFSKSGIAIYYVQGAPDFFYPYLDEAVTAAQGQSSKTVVVYQSGEICYSGGSTSYTIPSDVSLLIPYDASKLTPNGSDDYNPYALTEYVAAEANIPAINENVSYELVLPENNTLTVNGKLLVGGVIAGYNGISGATYSSSTYKHANLKLEQNSRLIVSDSSAVLSACGYVYGAGTVYAQNSGTVYEPFVFLDFYGGGYTLGTGGKAATLDHSRLIKIDPKEIGNAPITDETAIFPFMYWTMMNIQSNFEISNNGKLKGYIDLYAFDDHNRVTISVIDGTSGLLSVNGNTVVSCSYDPRKFVSTLNGGAKNTLKKVGRTCLQVKNGASMGVMSINLTMTKSKFGISVDVTSTFSTENMSFNIPYNMDIVLTQGAYTIDRKVNLLPGATLKVEDGATLTIGSSGKLSVLTSVFDQKTYSHSGETGDINVANISTFTRSGMGYPTCQDLHTAGLSSTADFVVNGTLKVQGKLGGVVQTDGDTGTIDLTSAAQDNLTVKTQLGGVGNADFTVTDLSGKLVSVTFYLHQAGASVHTLKAQVYNPVTNSLVNLTAGQTYKAIPDTGLSYEILDYTYAAYLNSRTLAAAEAKLSEVFSGKNLYLTTQGGWYQYKVDYVRGGNTVTHYVIGSTDSISYDPKFAEKPEVTTNVGSVTATASDTLDGVSVSNITQDVTVTIKDKVAWLMTGGQKAGSYTTIQEAVNAYQALLDKSASYVKMIIGSTETLSTSGDTYLDVNGQTVVLTLSGSGTVYGMDSSVTDYTSTPKGKLTCSGGTVAAITKDAPIGKHYVAIQDGSNYSFHPFNIYVSGYRFELAAPECALFFIGKFQGDDAAKKYLTSLGFTLKDGKDTPLGTDSYSLPENPENIPEESNPGESPVVRDADGAYLFEVYLMRSFEKDKPATAYTEEITAIAQAMFKNNGTQDSEPQKLSFQKAWEDALKGSGMDEKDKAILRNFLNKFGIKIQAE